MRVWVIQKPLSTWLPYVYMHGITPIYETWFNGFAQISEGVWLEVGGGVVWTHPSPHGDSTPANPSREFLLWTTEIEASDNLEHYVNYAIVSIN